MVSFELGDKINAFVALSRARRPGPVTSCLGISYYSCAHLQH